MVDLGTSRRIAIAMGISIRDLILHQLLPSEFCIVRVTDFQVADVYIRIVVPTHTNDA
jgi:hypothetical protein